MIDQRFKDLYYLTFGRLTFGVYAWIYLFSRHKYDNAILHIGCGPKYIDGMVNIDGNIARRSDICLDITLGLPFASNTIRGAYASHVMEHFDTHGVRHIMAEVHRVLRPGGVWRIGVPSLEFCIKEYFKGGGSLPDFPETFRSAGGKFSSHLLCANQHKIIFDRSFMTELLEDAGFREIRLGTPCKSEFFEDQMLRYEDEWMVRDASLIVEAVK